MGIDLNQGIAIIILGAIAWFIRFQLFPLLRDEWRKSQETRVVERKAYEEERKARDDERKEELREFKATLAQRDTVIAEQLNVFKQELATRDHITQEVLATNNRLADRLNDITDAITHNRSQRTRSSDDDTTNH